MGMCMHFFNVSLIVDLLLYLNCVMSLVGSG